MNKTQSSWMKGISALVIIVLIVIIAKHLYHKHVSQNISPQGGIVQSLGIQNESPQNSRSYQTVSGVVPIERWVTEKGVRVYFVKSNALPMVDIQICFDAGSARNGTKGGLAYLTNLLLSDGTDTLTADQVAESFDNVGANYDAESQRDLARVELRTLSESAQLVPAIKTLKAILSRPAFREQGFKREQQNTLIALKQQSQMPQKIAARAFYDNLYPNEPYANWVIGSDASIEALTPEDLRAFHQEYYVQQNAVVVIVGNVTNTEADAIAQALTNDLPAGNKPPDLPRPEPLKQPVTKIIDFPSTQTHILLGKLGIKQGDPDFYALYLGNHILGGNGLITRLFKTIRDEHGLAYSAYSYFQPMLVAGPFIMSCQTRNEEAGKALQLMQTLLRDYIDHGPTDAELQEAKQNLLGGYALQFDSNAAIANQVAALGFYDLPLDYFNHFKPTIEKLTVDDVTTAFQKHFANNNSSVVVMVGKTPAMSNA